MAGLKGTSPGARLGPGEVLHHNLSRLVYNGCGMLHLAST